MKLEIEIPKYFECDFAKRANKEYMYETQFENSLQRIKTDIERADDTLSGIYEIEIIDMLIEVFKKAKSIKV